MQVRQRLQQKTEDTLSHPRVGFENSDSSVNFPNGFEGRDGLNLCGDRQKLPFKILFFCPPQDPFNLSASEPLELQISHGPEALLCVLFQLKVAVKDDGITFSLNIVHISLYVTVAWLDVLFMTLSLTT